MRAEDERAHFDADADLREPVGVSFSRRLPWLILLFGLGMLVSSVASLFEEIISHISVIVAFQSLVLGMAGNVGTQSLAVTIRALTEGNLTAKRMRRLVLRETGMGFCNGVVLGNDKILPLRLGHFAELGPYGTIRLGLGAYSRIQLEDFVESDVVGQMERAENAVDLCGLLRRGVDLHFHGICADSLSDRFPHCAHLP